VPHADDEQRRRAERARRVALFRYELIQDVIDPALSSRQRGRLIRELAERAHQDPFGEQIRVSRPTIDRWIRWWRAGGFEALVPTPARVTPRTPAEVLALAAALKQERPERTAAQVTRILRAQSGWAPSERTLQRHFVRLELDRQVTAAPAPPVFGRFEADRPNQLWTGDALHGPPIAGRKTFLFCFIDDHSRAVMGARFGYHEDTVRLAAALRPALASRGVPEQVYVDNGSPFVDSWLLRACAVLGIKLVHSTPGRPQGRGKIERFFRTVREQFLVELAGDAAEQVGDLVELNRLLVAWVETDYHPRVHSETGAPPLRRWQAGLPTPLPRPTPAQLREAFLWAEHRTVTSSATVSLHANTYQVDPLLVGRKVELIFDPFDLTDIEVRHQQRSFGTAVAFRIGRHAHPKARPEQPDPGPPPPSGIDYLRLLQVAHQQQLAQRINYAALADADLDDDGHPHPLLTGVLADRHHPTPTDDHDGQIHLEIPGQLTLTQPDHADPDQERS
jgi:putative transposase